MLRSGSIRAVIDKSWPWGEATPPVLTAPMPSHAACQGVDRCLAGAGHGRNEQGARRGCLAKLDGAVCHATLAPASAGSPVLASLRAKIGFLFSTFL